MTYIQSASPQLPFTALYDSEEHLVDVSFKAELHPWGLRITSYNEGASLSVCHYTSNFLFS